MDIDNFNKLVSEYMCGRSLNVYERFVVLSSNAVSYMRSANHLYMKDEIVYVSDHTPPASRRIIITLGNMDFRRPLSEVRDIIAEIFDRCDNNKIQALAQDLLTLYTGDTHIKLINGVLLDMAANEKCVLCARQHIISHFDNFRRLIYMLIEAIVGERTKITPGDDNILAFIDIYYIQLIGAMKQAIEYNEIKNIYIRQYGVDITLPYKQIYVVAAI